METIHVTDQMFQSILGREVSTLTTFSETVQKINDKIRVVANSGRYASHNHLWVYRYVIAVDDLTELTDDEKLCRLVVSAVALPF